MLQGRRVAILIEDGFDGPQTVESMRAMKDAGAKVLLIGNLAGQCYRCKRGDITLHSDDAAGGVSAGDFDAVIVPGGQRPQGMGHSRPMVNLVRDAYHAERIVAAICDGPKLLAAAGILTGRRVTSCPEIEPGITAAGSQWVDKPVVRDGNIITSRKVADIPKFNKAIIEALMCRAA